jgi:hypothetical protein
MAMKILAATIGIAMCFCYLLAGCALVAPTDIGKEEYQANCAACHGPGGKGDGPQADMLATKPADLTMLAKKNGGEFPASRVYEIIDGRLEVAAHGSREMPVWGKEFLFDERPGPEDGTVETFSEVESRVNARIRALVDYVARLQD